MKNRFYLMRHGESLANLADLIISSPQAGCSGYGLSPLGQAQARAAALASGLGSDTLIVASDFLRAQQTARIAAEVLGCDQILSDTGLRERFFGDLEATRGGNYLKVWRQDEIDPSAPIFGVESSPALTARLRQVVDQLERDHSQRTILLVSHGDPMRFLELAFAGRPLTEHLKIPLFEPAEIRPLLS